MNTQTDADYIERRMLEMGRERRYKDAARRQVLAVVNKPARITEKVDQRKLRNSPHS